MKLTISGTLGSGKSTVAKLLAKKLGLNHYSTGGMMRAMADERGITLNDLQSVAEKDRTIDDEIDAKQKNIGITENNFILEGRLGYYFIPDSYKIYLKTRVEIAADRILRSMHLGADSARIKEGLSLNRAEIIKSLETRRFSELLRYKKLYKLNYELESNYDLVVDTSNMNAEQVSEYIIKEVKKNVPVTAPVSSAKETKKSAKVSNSVVREPKSNATTTAMASKNVVRAPKKNVPAPAPERAVVEPKKKVKNIQ